MKIKANTEAERDSTRPRNSKGTLLLNFLQGLVKDSYFISLHIENPEEVSRNEKCTRTKFRTTMFYVG